MGLPTRRRKTMMQQWEVPFPATAEDPLYSWVTRTPGPAKPTQKERRVKRKAGEAARKTVTPAAKSRPLRALRAVERKRGRDGVQAVTSRLPVLAKRGDKKPTPSVGAVPQRPAPRQLGARHTSAAAEPRVTYVYTDCLYNRQHESFLRRA